MDPATPDPATPHGGSADPAATGPAAADPAATGPAATDPAAPGPAATDPAATGPAATDPSAGGFGELAPLATPPAATTVDPLDFPGYRDKLARAHERAETDESVTVGTTRLGDAEVVAAIGAFDFLGGSMGAAHGERVASAMAAALHLGVPFVTVTASGGARMQEGMVSLVQMARAAEGVRRLREAGLPVLARFTSPTTGGVHASYGALADVVVADAGATIGFAGPRVVEAFTGEPVGDDSHTAEAALAGGLVDEVVPAADADAALAAWVRLLHPATRDGSLPDLDAVTGDAEGAGGAGGASRAGGSDRGVELDAWEAVQRARQEDRPTARQYLGTVFDEHRELRGDRAGADDPPAVAAVARLGGRSVVVAGFDRRGCADGPGHRPGQPTAAGYRKLRRAAVLAERWGLPLVTLIDTPGADPSPASDRTGLAGAIAETFVAVLSVSAPTVAVVTGEGGSGGALALGCTDRLLMQDDSVFEVIAPEGAAAILHRDASRAEEVAPLLQPTATQLRRLGIADGVLPGPTTAGADEATAALRATLVATLHELDAEVGRLDARRRRYGPA